MDRETLARRLHAALLKCGDGHLRDESSEQRPLVLYNGDSNMGLDCYELADEILSEGQ